MNDQMIRVISSPSSSTMGFLTLIFSAMGPSLSVGLGVRAHRRCARASMLGGARRCYRSRDFCFTVVMATISPGATGGTGAPWQTHEVFNQAPPLEGVDLFSSNLP